MKNASNKMPATADAMAQKSLTRRVSTMIRCITKFVEYPSAVVSRAFSVETSSLLFNKNTAVRKPESETTTVRKTTRGASPSICVIAAADRPLTGSGVVQKEVVTP